MAEKPTPKEHVVGAKMDTGGKVDTSKAAIMFVDDGEVAAAETERNTKNVRNLQEVFSTLATSPEEQHISLMLQEQSPLIIKYLKDTTKDGEGGDVYNDMAPGVAMLGFELSRSGFGGEEVDTGDKELNEQNGKTADKRYKAATEVFDQLIRKMYPEGTSRGDVLLAQLDTPISQGNEATFKTIKDGLTKLYKDGLPHDDKDILQYQRSVDSLINQVGSALGLSAETEAKLGVSGEITPEESKKLRTDMLTMATALKELQNLRRESVRHKYQSRAYENFTPRDLKRIEGLEQKIKTS